VPSLKISPNFFVKSPQFWRIWIVGDGACRAFTLRNVGCPRDERCKALFIYAKSAIIQRVVRADFLRLNNLLLYSYNTSNATRNSFGLELSFNVKSLIVLSHSKFHSRQFIALQTNDCFSIE